MSKTRPRDRDLRGYARGTQVRLLLGGLILVLVVGNGLVWMLYGPNAARLSLMCMGIFLVPGLMIGISLWLMQIVVRKDRDE